MERLNRTSNETMSSVPVRIAPTPAPSSFQRENNPAMPDLLWISKQQQQHPSTHAHPLKNTVRVSSNGARHKFDGKQWRLLCESLDGYECRNLAFRSSLCQKHFYKVHLVKRPYGKTTSLPTSLPGGPPLSLKRPSTQSDQSHYYYHPQNEHRDSNNTHDHMYEEEEDSIEVLDNNDFKMIQRDSHTESKNGSEPEFTFFSIDSDPQAEPYTHQLHYIKSQISPTIKRLNSTNNESIVSNESENLSANISIPKITESLRLGLPPLTRTEEKSLANELIMQLPTDASLLVAERIARRRACEIVMDNYSHHLSPINITSEWFYDFLLRNPRLPIHFQAWFSSIKPTLPSSDQTIDIKMWELGLVTRSVIPSSSNSTSSSSP